MGIMEKLKVYQAILNGDLRQVGKISKYEYERLREIAELIKQAKLSEVIIW